MSDTSERITLSVNGISQEVTTAPSRSLLEVLREDLALTGAKEGCGVGVCGACSVLVDGKLMSSCIVPVGMVQGRAVTTVEGLAAEDGTLTPVQTAFMECGGFQCGICTPGQVVAATALLRECPDPAAEEVREWMTGNLCRCTGYYSIVAAVLQAAKAGQGESD
ncbi:(2Fe-2S)-binding protein [Blastococcus saxobsidens]|uniref:Carbon-monoxide dehydrogenase small subunit n=1 Tax=Blastococcus saxobsidens TaxID=138336 RepID=A0A4Q7Y8P3_9ACTN|nr:(2Fe-2S)-binding protein [Blastococcus saxobsidens]RZU33462.1 carbon-monoxide dehydrogenase small subunit [Blastococcus saxobsidens]